MKINYEELLTNELPRESKDLDGICKTADISLEFFNDPAVKEIITAIEQNREEYFITYSHS